MKQFSLPERERIKKKKDFERIYNAGEAVFSGSKKLKAVFLIDEDIENPGLKVAFGVSKKAGNAVWRNRAKRLLRESYRLNKKILFETAQNSKRLIYIVFSLNQLNKRKSGKLYLREVMPDVIDMMNQINRRI